MFWDTTHEDLDKKINKLETRVLSSQSIFGYQSYQWNETIELCKEIQEDFKKKIRYPTKAERDEAWQKFFDLRENVYRIKREQFEYQSQQHYNEIDGYLREAYWSKFGDEIGDLITFYTAKTTKEYMKYKGQQLREAGNLLTKYKHEMTKDHKAEVHERIVSIRENHDVFWDEYKEYQKEKQQIYEQKKQAWEEGQIKRQNAKERIQANIEKNKENLYKVENALERQKQNRRNLEEKIASAYSDRFREQHEEWLDECNDKISDIESSIERIESWIQEGKDKLNSFY